MKTCFIVIAACVSMAGCIESDDGVAETQTTDELAVTTSNSAYTLTLTTDDPVDVASSEGWCRSCSGGPCVFAFVANAVATLRVPFPTDKVNCIHFGGWTGACADQFNPCVLTMNSDKVTDALWPITKGCNPK